jgi:hypothetical protein
VKSLRCKVEVPAGDAAGPIAAERLERATGEPLTLALAGALGDLDGYDTGAVWVVRRLAILTAVPLSDQDVERQAARVADAIAGGVRLLLRMGPGGDVVRFDSRADHLAAFVTALLVGAGDGWMFEVFDGLRLLRPAPALVAGAERVAVPAAEVVALVASRGGLRRLLAVSSAAELTPLWEACRATSRRVEPPDAFVERVVAVVEAGPPVGTGTGGYGLHLGLFATLAAEVGPSPELVAAVARVADRLVPDPARGTTAPGPDTPPGGAAGAARSARGTKSGPGVEPAGPPVADPGGRPFMVLSGPGAPAFLALPSLAAVGLGALPGPVRVRVLARLLGLPDDDAVLRLAGDPERFWSGGDGEGNNAAAVGVAAARAGLLEALVSDDRIDGRQLVGEIVTDAGGRRAAVVRDAAHRTWLAGALLAEGEAAPFSELVSAVEQATGQAGYLVTAEPSDAAAADLAWLAPADDVDLALALMARAAMQHLARRLLGFERAAMPYLVERFLPPGGAVLVNDASIVADLPRPPLHVVLTMAGLDSFTYSVPWHKGTIEVAHPE